MIVSIFFNQMKDCLPITWRLFDLIFVNQSNFHWLQLSYFTFLYLYFLYKLSCSWIVFSIGLKLSEQLEVLHLQMGLVYFKAEKKEKKSEWIIRSETWKKETIQKEVLFHFSFLLRKVLSFSFPYSFLFYKSRLGGPCTKKVAIFHFL